MNGNTKIVKLLLEKCSLFQNKVKENGKKTIIYNSILLNRFYSF